MKGLEDPATQGSVEVSATHGALLPAAPLTLDEVYRAYARVVARWVHRLGGPGLDVEDCVHDIFLVVESRLRHFRGDARLTTWLYRITHNVIRNQRRKHRLRRWLTGGTQELAGEIPEPGLSAPEAMEAKRRRRELYKVLDTMSERGRTAFILFELEQLSGAEVAELMGAKTSTVWVWLHRARAEFKKCAAHLLEEEP